MGSALLQAFAARLAEWRRLRAIANEAFAYTGDQRHIVRRDAVARHVAERLGMRCGKGLRASLLVAMKGAGWVPGSNGGRRIWVGVRLRAHTNEEALEASRALRKEVKA